jgi:choline kinase
VIRQVIILAAGMGTRLGKPWPKPLTPLKDGRTIMQQQMENITKTFGSDSRIGVVVGFKLEMIMEAHPRATFIYNELYDQTNTSKSLWRALVASQDVVFDPKVLERVKPFIEKDQSFICVNTSKTAEEEVKYTVDAAGHILDLSKKVQNALGEAVGINFVSAKDKEALIKRLNEVDDGDYFERGIEVAIEKDKVTFLPVDISDLFAVEVDFPDDLIKANEGF